MLPRRDGVRDRDSLGDRLRGLVGRGRHVGELLGLWLSGEGERGGEIDERKTRVYISPKSAIVFVENAGDDSLILLNHMYPRI